MKNKNLIYLILSLGITASISLVNRFVATIPGWLASLLAASAATLLIIFIIKTHHVRKAK
jgi:hypothetical protein